MRLIDVDPILFEIQTTHLSIISIYKMLQEAPVVGCVTCRHYSKDADEEPCRSCRFSSMWDKNKQQPVSGTAADNRKDG